VAKPGRYVTSRQADKAGVERIDLIEGGYLLWIPQFLKTAESAALFDQLHATLAWEQSVITLFGRQVPIPRRNAWYADEGCHYRYSGTSFKPAPWTRELQTLRRDINTRFGLTLNSVLANLYRSGSDSMGWHSDDEPELGPLPTIASLSLGGSRRFLLRPKDPEAREHQLEFELTNGSLLLMAGSVQHLWKHSVPKTAKAVQPRINLTFRQVVEKRTGPNRDSHSV
jgi:alkylated DNA repair dioxygenase AlkB